MKCSLGISNFLEEISSLSHSRFFPLFVYTNYQGKLSYLSLLFFGTQHSNGCIIPFLLCFLPLFFSQVFLRPPQTAFLPFSVQFSRSVMSDSLQLHELQHTRPPCPSPTPEVHANPCPLSWQVNSYLLSH